MATIGLDKLYYATVTEAPITGHETYDTPVMLAKAISAELSIELAQKYGLSSCSIFLENDLLCKEKRVIYGNAKGGHYGQKDNKS
jgi:hypothetical protein